MKEVNRDGNGPVGPDDEYRRERWTCCAMLAVAALLAAGVMVGWVFG